MSVSGSTSAGRLIAPVELVVPVRDVRLLPPLRVLTYLVQAHQRGGDPGTVVAPLWTTLEAGIWLSVEGARCTGELGAPMKMAIGLHAPDRSSEAANRVDVIAVTKRWGRRMRASFR